MTENYNLFNDEKLAELAQAGDETAEEVLINRYKELVKSRRACILLRERMLKMLFRKE